MTDRYADINGIKLHYVIEGDKGPLVILLHGFPEFWYAWHNQIPALSPYCRVVAPDMRGYNLSSKPKGVKNYTLDTLAADIKALIAHLGESKAYIVGHDWGGCVAWALAAFNPEVVEKLAILNMPHPAEMRQQLLAFNWQQWKKSWYVFFFQLPYLPESRLQKNVKGFFKAALRGWAFRKEAFPDQVIDQYVAVYSQKDAFEGPINYYRALFRNMGILKKMKHIEMPVLMLWGENDKALGKELAANTPNYCQRLSLRYIPNCSHWIQHDYPELVNSYLLDFILPKEA